MTAVNEFGAEELLSRRARQSNGTYVTTSYQFDPSGNVAERLNGGGQVTGCDLYAAYGARVARQGTVDPSDPWGYEAQFGYYGDAETGLLLLGSRYYDPQAGRFVTRDPIGAEGGANLYAYADGDPVDNVDPDGTGPRYVMSRLSRGWKRVVHHWGSELHWLFLGNPNAHINQPTFAQANPIYHLDRAGPQIRSFEKHQAVGAALAIGAAVLSIYAAAGGEAEAQAQADAAAEAMGNLEGHWGEGTFGSREESLLDHFSLHGPEVNARTPEEYLRKAEGFKLRIGKRAQVRVLEGGAKRYTKDGLYIILNEGKEILSFGLARR